MFDDGYGDEDDSDFYLCCQLSSGQSLRVVMKSILFVVCLSVFVSCLYVLTV